MLIILIDFIYFSLTPVKSTSFLLMYKVAMTVSIVYIVIEYLPVATSRALRFYARCPRPPGRTLLQS